MLEKSLHLDARLPPPARRLSQLVGQLAGLNRHQTLQVIHERHVRVNGVVVTRPQLVLEPGDHLQIAWDPAMFQSAPPASPVSQSLEIVFEDEHLVVVGKPPALLTVPTRHRERTTLISLLEKRLQAARPGQRAYCVHRLDRGVSGLLVFGKRLEIAAAIRDQFEARKPERRYVAIVAGRVAKPRGTFRTYLATDADLNRFSTQDASQGELAVTHYQVTRRCANATVVEVTLETGRRNQIRVHFAESGHPVLGDPRYGNRAAPQVAWPHRRLALHAATLGFRHPVDGRSLRFRSPLPPEMSEFLGSVRSPHD
ncbi:MAG: RluA family pseudouridine synthase [Pirellulaceae bacterium]